MENHSVVIITITNPLLATSAGPGHLKTVTSQVSDHITPVCLLFPIVAILDFLVLTQPYLPTASLPSLSPRS